MNHFSLVYYKSEYANKYLHVLKGIVMSFSAHSSLTSMTSGALPISFAAFRYSFACLIRDAVYSGMSVFMIFQKYYLSDTRPLGKWVGKYCINLSSFCIYGQKLRTDSSSYLGTLIRLTSLSSYNFFFPDSTSFRKSLFFLYNYICVMY